jgi:hypothetical protein
LRKRETAKPATRTGRRKGENDTRKEVKTMIRKSVIAFLGMALLVASPGFAARAYTADVRQTVSDDRKECVADGAWFDTDIDYCEMQAP